MKDKELGKMLNPTLKMRKTLLFFLILMINRLICIDSDCQDICESMLETYVNIELANLLTKCTLLIIGQIQDVFNASRNKVSSSSVKAMQVYLKIK